MTIDFRPPALPEDFDLDGTIKKEWTIRIVSWHDPEDIQTYGPPDSREILDFINSLLQVGYQDIWIIAEATKASSADENISHQF